MLLCICTQHTEDMPVRCPSQRRTEDARVRLLSARNAITLNVISFFFFFFFSVAVLTSYVVYASFILMRGRMLVSCSILSRLHFLGVFAIAIASAIASGGEKCRIHKVSKILPTTCFFVSSVAVVTAAAAVVVVNVVVVIAAAVGAPHAVAKDRVDVKRARVSVSV